MGGGWLASVAKGPSRTDAFRNPLEKGLQPDIRARRFSLGRVRSCVFRRVHEDEGDDDEVEEGTYAREFRSGTSERTGVTFRLKGKRRV